MLAVAALGTGLFLMGAPSSALAETKSTACDRSEELQIQVGMGVKVPDNVLLYAQRQCSSGSNSADRVPLRPPGDWARGRQNKPCSHLGKHQGEANGVLEAECVADWLEYARFKLSGQSSRQQTESGLPAVEGR
jgi:hypothetical protein